jgi:anti-sigma factor RsiW
MKNCRDIEPLMAPYVDGEADPARRADVDQHIHVCSECRGEVAAQRAARDVLQARRDQLREPASSSLHARCAAHAREQMASGFSRTDRVRRKLPLWQKVPLAAAATILLAVAAVFGLGLTNKVEALALQMTLDHAKCARFNSSSSPADPVAAGQQWAAKFGWPLTVPPSSGPTQLELRAVRRCGVTDGRVAHLIYDWRGEPLSVYVLPSQAIGAQAAVQRFGHESVMWSQNGRTYVVLASASRRPELEGVVQYVKATVY